MHEEIMFLASSVTMREGPRGAAPGRGTGAVATGWSSSFTAAAE
jgi:hypothetical protein